MSHVIDHAEELRKRAIDILVTERTAIDERLAVLGYDRAEAPCATSNKRRACSLCGSADHNARRCPRSNAPASPIESAPAGS